MSQRPSQLFRQEAIDASRGMAAAPITIRTTTPALHLALLLLAGVSIAVAAAFFIPIRSHPAWTGIVTDYMASSGCAPAKPHRTYIVVEVSGQAIPQIFLSRDSLMIIKPGQAAAASHASFECLIKIAGKQDRAVLSIQDAGDGSLLPPGYGVRVVASSHARTVVETLFPSKGGA